MKNLHALGQSIIKKPLGVVSFILVIAIGIAIAAYTTRAQATPAAPEEITPAVEQQKPIMDLIAEQARSNQGYQDKIDGALRMLMAQIKDPVTGKLGLDAKEWNPQGDGKGGVKFVSLKRAVATPSPTPSPAPSTEK